MHYYKHILQILSMVHMVRCLLIHPAGLQKDQEERLWSAAIPDF